MIDGRSPVRGAPTREAAARASSSRTRGRQRPTASRGAPSGPLGPASWRAAGNVAVVCYSRERPRTSEKRSRRRGAAAATRESNKGALFHLRSAYRAPLFTFKLEQVGGTRQVETISLLVLLLLLLAGALCSLSCSKTAAASPTTTTSTSSTTANMAPLATSRLQGTFEGVWLAPNVAGFLGIRYASAPVRRLRFMPPTTFQYAPNQLHAARKLGPNCHQLLAPQLDMNSARGQLMDGHNGLSEDCLSLNVYAPRLQPGNKAHDLPVLVIIHGAGEFAGRPARQASGLQATPFVARAKQLVVTFNYRLDLLGFPPPPPSWSPLPAQPPVVPIGGNPQSQSQSPPPSTANSPRRAPNLGFMDQIAALHWIRDNIEAFGGSPEKITVLGAKRAAIFVNLLMLSPLAKGLFQRAILEDGSVLSPLAAPSRQRLLDAHTQLAKLARQAECPAREEPLECLRWRPLEQLQPQQLSLPMVDGREAPLQLVQQAGGRHFASAPHWQAAASAGRHQWSELQTATGQLQQSPSNSNDSLPLIALRSVPLDGARSVLDQLNYLARAPLFGPHLGGGGGTNDEDLAASMLAPGSPFGQHHLLIAFSSSSSSSTLKQWEPPTGEEEHHKQLAAYLVATFARSFYRYHTQEIANSIIERYLAGSDSGKLLEKLLTAFEDALIRTPVLKTAIIHAIKQLEPLLDQYLNSGQLGALDAFGRQNFVRLARRKTYLFRLEPSAREQLSFSCTFDWPAESALIGPQERRLCLRMSSLLARFVAGDDHQLELDPDRASDWAQFDLFTWRPVNLAAAESVGEEEEERLVASSEEPLASELVGRVAFWANFVGALNCSRTQPIGVGASAGNELAALSLQASCGSSSGSPRSAREALERFEQAAWERHRAAASASVQRPTVATDSTSSSGSSNQSGWPRQPDQTAASSIVGKQPELAAPPNRQQQQQAAMEQQKRFAGLALLVCGCLLLASCLTALCALSRRRQQAPSNSKQQQLQPANRPPQPTTTNGCGTSAAMVANGASGASELFAAPPSSSSSSSSPPPPSNLDGSPGQLKLLLSENDEYLLCGSQPIELPVQQAPASGKPMKVPILTSSSGAQSSAATLGRPARRRRVQISEPHFCPVHQAHLLAALDVNNLYLADTGQQVSAWPEPIHQQEVAASVEHQHFVQPNANKPPLWPGRVIL